MLEAIGDRLSQAEHLIFGAGVGAEARLLAAPPVTGLSLAGEAGGDHPLEGLAEDGGKTDGAVGVRRGCGFASFEQRDDGGLSPGLGDRARSQEKLKS